MSTITVELKDLAIAYRCLSDAKLSALSKRADKMTAEEHAKNAKRLEELSEAMKNPLWEIVRKWIHEESLRQEREYMEAWIKAHSSDNRSSADKLAFP